MNIIEKPLGDAFSECFEIYGASTLKSRAIPNVEDGLTPVNRRILWTFHQEGASNFKKAAFYVGGALSSWHPHGDLSLYDTMTGLAQWWKNQKIFIEPQGNIGSVAGKPPAAARYLELKLSSFSKEIFFEDVDKEIVDMEDNYDKTKKIPKTFPSKFPTILNTGMMGIGTGYATDIPIHAVSDVCRAALAALTDPSADSKTIAKALQGPDFPTGGEIINSAALPQMYEDGQGVIYVRGVIEEEKRGGKDVLVIREIPPKRTTGKIVEEISALCKEKEEGRKKVPGLLQDKIADIHDFTAKDKIEIVIHPKRDVSLPVLKNLILEHTSMTFTHKYMMNVLIGGEFVNNASLELVMRSWIEYRRRTVRRKFVFQVGKILERMAILRALIKALENIEAVLKIVRGSKNKDEAVEKLMKGYDFAEREAKYVVEQPIYRLTGMEIAKLKEELKEKKVEADRCVEILRDSGEIDCIIREELEGLVKKYETKRHTKLINAGKVSTLDVIERKDLIVAVTEEGYVFSKEVDDVKAGNKGNKGQLLVDSKRGRSIEKSVLLDSHDELFVFSEDGKMFKANAYEFDVNNVHISSVIKNFGARRVCQFIPVHPDSDGDLVFVTTSALTKRVKLSEFRTRNMPEEGLIAAQLAEGERLIGVHYSDSPDDDLIVIATSRGYASKIPIANLSLQKRPSMGRRMIRLKEEKKGVMEQCVSLVGCRIDQEENTAILFITTKGKGKMVKVSDLLYKKTESGQGAAFLAIKLRPEDKLRRNVVCGKDEQLVVTSKGGKTVRMKGDSIAEMKREAMGYTIIALNDGDEVASVTVA